MLPPSLRAEAEDKYEVLQGGVFEARNCGSTVRGINYSLYVRDIYNRCAY